MIPLPSVSSNPIEQLTIAGLAAIVVLTLAAISDITHQRIYNRLTYSAMLAGLLLAALGSLLEPSLSMTTLSLGESTLGLIGCGLLMLIPYCGSGGGAGDVKLAMAVGSLVGFTPTLQGFCLGYVIAAAYLISRFIGVLAPNCWSCWQTAGLRTQPADMMFSIRQDSHAWATISRPLPLGGFFLLGMAWVALGGVPA